MDEHQQAATTDHTPADAPGEDAPAAGRSWIKVAVGVVLVLAVGGGLLYEEGRDSGTSGRLSRDGDALSAAKDAAELRYLGVAQAQLQPPLPPLPAPARVLVDDARAVRIVAPLAGRIEEIVVQLGARVKKGAKLMAVRSASLPELKGQMDVALTTLELKRASSERLRTLVDLHAVPEKDLLLAQQEQEEAEIGLRAVQGRRVSLRLDKVDHSGLYWLTAPRDGIVVEREALEGMEVGPDRQEPLLAIADLDRVMVVADMLEIDAGGVKPGQKVDVLPDSLSGASAEGVIEYVSAMLDPSRRTVAVRVKVPNPDGLLRPNAFAHVVFKEASGGPQIVVSDDAVVTDGQRSVVFVRRDDGGRFRFTRRAVKIGRRHNGQVEIRAGLEPRETYVERGALLLLNALDLES